MFYGLQVNFFVGAFYDGVYLLGMALNETLSEGEDIHNGTAITRRMWNRDFHGKGNTTSNTLVTCFYFSLAQQPNAGQGRLILDVS
jgi:hypothetical protein